MSEEKYDSAPDTIKHIDKVTQNIYDVVDNLHDRSLVHDLSKLHEPEKPIFDKMTQKLAKMEYGSEEYKQSLKDLGPALEHHYANNTHHPEHWENGVSGMSLLDIIEMVCDWKAAAERTKDGDIWKSLDINFERFNFSYQLQANIRNTVMELWPPEGDEHSEKMKRTDIDIDEETAILGMQLGWFKPIAFEATEKGEKELREFCERTIAEHTKDGNDA